MPKFLFVYHGGGMPETPEEGEKMMADWGAWYEGMGAALADPGGAVGMSHTVSGSGIAEDGGSNPSSGFTVVEAADHAAACEIAKGCPMVKDGSGSVEVAPIMDM
ncbi:YciI family protein [Flavimaricola marinus]|uniref:YCII-related domain protein n=1 Tax=Flavimaricola marinus TaxID=1819565 RepID=A0A238LF25_9RHOB|nr:YciI family protein [Flavimaricola marinus]SMY08279.1 YCII-related domain protein [Flavimaricola marinus]